MLLTMTTSMAIILLVSMLMSMVAGFVVDYIERFQVDPHQPQTPAAASNHTIACYYTNTILNETIIDPFVCTHIIFGSAILSPTGMTARNHSDIYSWRLLVKLKKKNPKVKILISACCNFDVVVGKGPDVLASFAEGTRQLFREFDLDGLDVDWEFPGIWKRNKYLEFQKVVSAMLRSEGKLFTAAMPHDLLTFVESYYVEAVNKFFDFMTIMTYDYYSYTPRDPYTDYNSPLANASAVINQIKDIAGVDPSKLLIGYATYARSYKLADPKNHGHRALAVGTGPPGPYLNSSGYYALSGVCLEMKKGAKIVQDPVHGAEYMYNGVTWVSFNGMYSAKIEAEYVKESGIGGFGFFALEFADFKNICGYGPYPVFNYVKKILAQP